MAREVRTDLLISAKTRGFAKAQQETARITKENAKAIDKQIKGYAESTKGLKGFEKEIKNLEGGLASLAKKQLAITGLMKNMGDKGTPQFKQLATELKNVEREASQTTRALSLLDRVTSKKRDRQQGLLQGFGQGVAPGSMGFIQRGPGMQQQMIGAAAGSGVRAAGSAVSGGMFSGMGGLSKGLAGIPGIGGALAAGVDRAMQQGQLAMQYQQTMMGAQPNLGGIGLQRKAGQAAKAAYAPASQEAQEAALSKIGSPEMERDIRIATSRLMKSVVEDRASKGAPQAAGLSEKIQSGLGIGKFSRIEGLKREMEERHQINAAEKQKKFFRQSARTEVEASIRGEASTAGRKAGSAAAQAARNRAINGALGLGAGTQFGMALPEEVNFRSSVQQAGGGYGNTKDARGFGTTAMAANRAYGVGAGVSGTFLQAQRRGGLVGGVGGDSGTMLTETIADAMTMGLEGSEVNSYLQEVASGITRWKSTGIPFNTASMKGMVSELGTSLGGVRGMGVAKGFTGAGLSIGQRGPQSAAEVAVFNALSGLKPGETSLDKIEEAMIKMERGDFEKGGIEKALKMLGAGEGSAGRMTALSALRRMGIQIDRGEFQDLATGKPVTAAEMERRNLGAGAAPTSKEDLAAQARSFTPKAVRQQAEIINQQISSGTKVLGSIKSMEKAATDLTTAITTTLAPALKVIGIHMEALTSKVADTVKTSNAEVVSSVDSN